MATKIKYKNITIKKKGGGTRKQRVRVLASGKFKFVKNLTTSKSRTTSKSKSKSKTTTRKTTRKVKNMGKKGGNLQATVFKYIRIGSLLGTGVARGAAIIQAEGKESALRAVSEAVTQYGGFEDGEFHAETLMKAWLPFLGATLATYGIPKIAGIIRRL